MHQISAYDSYRIVVSIPASPYQVAGDLTAGGDLHQFRLFFLADVLAFITSIIKAATGR